jgi:DGQHR domain-containing protein
MTKHQVDVQEKEMSFALSAIRVAQPIGEFYIASISHKQLYEISYFDVRRMLKDRDVEEYLGIQRPLSPSRVDELQQYVRTVDACFPTSIVLAVDGKCAVFDEQSGKLTLSNFLGDEERAPILYREIAKVLDGQHRIAGLENLPAEMRFELNVSIFVDIELEDQAYVFSIVNLAQTKVHRSLAYDLFELSHARSPQKTAHNVAVALDRTEGSPLRERIKRLGAATPGRENEVLTQATVVEGILPLISKKTMLDRDVLKRKGSLPKPTREELQLMPLRGLFVEKEDAKIVEVLWNFFEAVATRWPTAWGNLNRGAVLARTNGFRALMKVFSPIYLSVCRPGEIASAATFRAQFEKVTLGDADFTVDHFKPGSSGESALVARLLNDMRLQRR